MQKSFSDLEYAAKKKLTPRHRRPRTRTASAIRKCTSRRKATTVRAAGGRPADLCRTIWPWVGQAGRHRQPGRRRHAALLHGRVAPGISARGLDGLAGKPFFPWPYGLGRRRAAQPGALDQFHRRPGAVATPAHRCGDHRNDRVRTGAARPGDGQHALPDARLRGAKTRLRRARRLFCPCVCQVTEVCSADGNDGAHSPIKRKSHVSHSAPARALRQPL